MNNSKKSQRNKALLILATSVFLFVTVVILPYLSLLDDNQETIENLRFKLEKYQRTAQQTEQLKQKLQQLESRDISRDDLLPGDSAAIAGANLQEMISQRIKNHSGQLNSIRILSVADEEHMERITIQAQFNSDISTLQRLLYKIEFEKPQLFVDKINIRSKKIKSRRTPTSKDTLKITIDISGYRFKGETES